MILFASLLGLTELLKLFGENELKLKMTKMS